MQRYYTYVKIKQRHNTFTNTNKDLINSSHNSTKMTLYMLLNKHELAIE